MTINKAQGQTLERVGIYLPEPCFTHGQLYVAASRVGLPDRQRYRHLPHMQRGLSRGAHLMSRQPAAPPPSLIVRKQIPVRRVCCLVMCNVAVDPLNYRTQK